MIEETRPLPGAIEDECEVSVSSEIRGRWTRRLQYVEPVMFLTILSNCISLAVQVNTIELQYCKAVLGIYNSSRCLNPEASYFTDVQKHTSTFLIFQTTCDSVFPIFSSVFLGPWSDIFGRRPVLISCSIGYVLTSILWVWGSTTNLHPNYFLLFNFPLSLSGGGLSMISAMFCYLCDTTTLDMRAQRLGILYGIINVGTLIASLVAPNLIKISYTFTFAVCAFTNVIKLLYILVFLKESVETQQYPSVSKNPFQWRHIRSLYEVCYMKQSSHVFHLIVYLALLSLVSHVQENGEFSVLYLLLQNILGWTLIEYTPLNCASIVSFAFSAFIGSWFLTKLLSLDDMEVINIANGFRLVGASIFAFSRRVWLIYVARILNGACGLYESMIRTSLSRIVHSDDLGKIFVLYGLLDSLTPFFGSLIYNTMYKETMNTYPTAIFLVSAFLCLLMTLCTAKIVSLKLRPSTKTTSYSTVRPQV